MRYLLLATASLTPLAAEVVSDEAAKVTVGLYSQIRAEISHGVTNSSATATDPYSPSENAKGQPDTADFYFRRFRPIVSGVLGDGFIFNATLAADNLGRNAGSSANVTLFEGYSGKKFVIDDLTHTITVGKRTAWFYTGNAISSTALLPSQRAGTPGAGVNGAGLTYRLESPFIRFGCDVMNNSGTGRLPAGATGGGDDQGSAGSDGGEGLWYSTRVEVTGPEGWTSKWQESFAGQPGHGVVLAAEAGAVNRDRYILGANQGIASARLFGLEALLHLDGLTAVADIRFQRSENSVITDARDAVIDSRAWNIQAGYAIDTGWSVIPVFEPAARYTVIDNDLGRDEMTTDSKTLYSSGDCPNSGRQIEFGINGYINRHKNKLSLDYIHWRSESLDVDSGTYATADIIRLQHQLNF